MNRIQKVATVGSVVGMLLAAPLGTTEAHHGAKPRPKGYGTNPCVTLLHDLHKSPKGYADRDEHFRMNLIGCHDRWGTGVYTPERQANACEREAHRQAKRLAKGGLLRDLAKIGPAVAKKLNRPYDRCTVAEDWSWYDADNRPVF